VTPPQVISDEELLSLLQFISLLNLTDGFSLNIALVNIGTTICGINTFVA
jgi:hypothetical protein